MLKQQLKPCLISAALIALVFLNGCALFSKPVGMAAVDRFKTGVTTIDQATNVLGRPQSFTQQSDGSIVVGWLHRKTTNIGPDTQGVAILFDSNGKMVKVTQKYQNKFGY